MRRRIPSLQALDCLAAAARHESYTRAAEELALTQSAVSRQIAALEDYLGLPLFRRTRHGVALTPAGAQYARQVAAPLDALERRTLDAMARQGRGGTVQLAVVPTLATRWLMPRLPALLAAHPGLTVHVDVRTRPFLFAETEFDAAIFASTEAQLAQWPGTRRDRLMPEEVLPVCSPAWRAGWRRGRALKPADLADAPLLQASTRPEAWREWFEACGVAAPQALSGPRFELFSMLAVAAAAGMGVALIPRLLIEPELTRGELVPACTRLPPLPVGRHYWLIAPEAGASEAGVLPAVRHWLLDAAQAPA